MVDFIDGFFSFLRRDELVLPVSCYPTVVADHPSLKEPSSNHIVGNRKTTFYSMKGFDSHYRQFFVFQEGLEDLYHYTSHLEFTTRNSLNALIGEANSSAIRFYRAFEKHAEELAVVQKSLGVTSDYYLIPKAYVNFLPQGYTEAEQAVVACHKPFNINMRRIKAAACHMQEVKGGAGSFFEYFHQLGGIASTISVCMLIGLSLDEVRQGEDITRVVKNFSSEILMSCLSFPTALILEGVGWVIG